MENFTPYSALAGGVLLGIATTLLLWLNGRLAGVSTIASGLLVRKPGDSSWRLAFLVGLVAGAGIYYLAQGAVPPPRTDFPGWLLAAAGLLIGFGTAFGNGCTSGHGICGLARLSERSMVATATFLGAGILAASITRQLFGTY